MLRASALLLPLLLAGCSSAAQRAALDDKTCQSYGAKPGTSDYVTCRTQRDAQRYARATAIATSPEPTVVVVPGR